MEEPTTPVMPPSPKPDDPPLPVSPMDFSGRPEAPVDPDSELDGEHETDNEIPPPAGPPTQGSASQENDTDVNDDDHVAKVLEGTEDEGSVAGKRRRTSGEGTVSPSSQPPVAKKVRSSAPPTVSVPTGNDAEFHTSPRM